MTETATELEIDPPDAPAGLEVWYIVTFAGRKGRYPATKEGVAAAVQHYRAAARHPANEVRAVATSTDPAVVERYRDVPGWCDLHARHPVVSVASTLDVDRGEWGPWQ